MSLMRTSTATRTSSEVPLQRLDGDDEVEGRELVLRGGKLSPRSSPAFDPSERRQRQPIHPIPVSSARVDQKDGPQRVIGGNANVQNSTNAKAGSQTLENPSATNFLTNSAPIYNQNVNSGSGQQNIKVIGDFEVPSSYTPTAAPPEYEIPFESEHNEKRGSGLQKSNVSNGIKNKTAGDDRPNGYSQTLRDPHGHLLAYLDRRRRLAIGLARLIGSLRIVGEALWHLGHILRIGIATGVNPIMMKDAATFVQETIDPARLLGSLRATEMNL
ncbi:hypothetical protein J4E82_006833 [Alternaria postmessia]|uniref:uncharacterized protein n=1 Tax=Alternaria postmessia TaxID=1187938 RepID=UPI0022255B8A|nr:uncharacterized protein J4E82_006833 [Alternaria postmessia]KAI5374418.1 hypothetical protein J4E82_006833 [Alternaria postmessia]